ncbi:MAG TPA: cytochrome c oxidase subunit II [Microthrixaceae bacterium]|nr:cytochrome c oxidase subunit II [Microthrixaceae bacterium]
MATERSDERNKRSATIITGITLAVVLILGYLMVADIGKPDGRPLNTLAPAGGKAQEIQNLIIPVFAIAGVAFILVEVGIIWLAARYRRRPEDVDGVGEPTQLHGNTKLEIGWTLAPALLLAALAVFSVNGILSQDDATDPIDITVIGQQWWWEYRYDLNDDGKPDIITANEAAIPVGRDVRFHIQSRDVIHSFWIPRLAGKLDAVPSRTHIRVMDADEVGIYQGQCTEYCGLSHGVMRMQVKALSVADYELWVKRMTTVPEQPKTEIEIEGQKLFVAQCSFCHQVNGINPGDSYPFKYSTEPDPDYGVTNDSPLASRNAPNLTHFMLRQHFVGGLLPLFQGDQKAVLDPSEHYDPDVNNIKRWLRDPEEVKPMNPENNQGMPNYNLSEAQISQLTAYLLTLK